ncbi:MAG: hypothetical protein U1F68_04785 [Gammaproteobacteria bacterium]
MKTSMSCLAVLVLGAGVMASPVYAQRWVVVNGQVLTQQQIAWLDGVNCEPLADGFYWFDMASGVWGYQDNPQPQGRLGQACAGGGYHRRGQFGDLGGDDNGDHYYFDPESGCSVMPGGGLSC